MPPRKPAPEPFGAVLERLRTAAGLSRDVLAAELGVTGETVRLWEIGARQPKWPAVQQLADRFAVPTDALRGT